MLKISEMELIGFKSFQEKANLSFTGGVTAVVGPNGCGKSNISDALSWVLGEQSAKSLRGSRMEDVIFNGSAERKPLGMAEVTLKLVAPSAREDAPEGSLEEILVTRRLFRDGESEYCLNGKRCRKLDIEDALYGYGVDGKAYAIIEQGRIGMILSGRSADRRLLIEEAAGIHHYKGKKHQAELRLEASTANLERIEDIIGEVKRQLGSLKRQASRAERFKDMKQAQRRIERILFGKQYRVRVAAREELADRHGLASERLAAELSELTAAEAELEELRASRGVAEHELVGARDALHDLRLRIERKEADLRQIEAESTDLATRSERSRHAVGDTERRIGEAAEQRGRLEGELGDRAREVSRKEDELRVAQEATRLLLERIHEREASLQAHKDRLFGAANGLSTARNSLQKLSALMEKARGTQEKHRLELHATATEVGRLDEARGELARRTESGRAGLSSLDETLAVLREDFERLGAGRREAEEHRERARGERDEASHRLRSLEEIERRRLSYEESVKAFYDQHPEAAAATSGLVADHLQVPERLEAAAEAALGEALQWIVVSDVTQARSCAALLADDGAGRAGFLPLTGPRAQDARLPTVEGPGLVGWLADHLTNAPEAPAGFGERLRAVLPPVLVVEHLDAALAMAEVTAGLTLVTLAGELVRPGGVVVAGRRGGPSILAVKREVRELGARLVELGEDLAGREQELAAIIERERDVDARMREVEGRRRELERQSITLGHESEQIRAALERLGQRRQVLQMELEEVDAELGAYATEEAELRISEAEQQARVVELEEEGLRHADDLRATREGLPEARAREDETSQAVSAARELRARTETELRGLSERTEELGRELERLRRDLATMQERLTVLGESRAVATDDLRQLAESQEGAAATVREHEERARELLAREEEVLANLKERRAAHEEARERLGTLEVERAGVEAELRHLADRCRESLHAPIEQIAAELEGEDPSAPEEELADEAQRLAERIEALGPVNLMAIEEARELEERHDFLTQQHDDVVKSIEDIRKTIRKINETSRERFNEAFAIINGHFQEAFVELFGGGQAELRLVGDDVLDAGVEVVAQPPGKRLQNILLLSGGEKALSAMALLFAIFQYRPSPFCVLDEVDAPLDEANVSRFTKLLRRLQERTQFILITHNKTTMEIAEQLYGISMDEPGISKVYSLRLGPQNGNGNGHGDNGHGGNGNGNGGNGNGKSYARGDIRQMARRPTRRAARPAEEEVAVVTPGAEENGEG